MWLAQGHDDGRKKRRKLDIKTAKTIGKVPMSNVPSSSSSSSSPRIRTYSAEELQSKHYVFQYKEGNELEAKENKDSDVTVDFNASTMHIHTVTADGSQYRDGDTLVYRLLPRKVSPKEDIDMNLIHAHEYCIRKLPKTKRGDSHRSRTNDPYVVLGSKAMRGGVSHTEAPSRDVRSPYDAAATINPGKGVQRVRSHMSGLFLEYVH